MEQNSKEPVFRKSKYKGRPIWTCDAETDPFLNGRVPSPFIWGVYTGFDKFIPGEIDGCVNLDQLSETNYLEFFDREAMIAFLQDQKVIVYAHNGGKFDWHFITDFIDDFEPLTIIAGRLAKFVIGDCEFRDSYNIIPAPLSAYQKDEIDYKLFEIAERNKPENMAKIREYLKADCVYLWELVWQFVETYGLHITQASAAMTIWSKMTGVSKPQTGPGYYDDMSRYYYGGRVECFKTGIIEKPFSVIDIRSAYPKAMTKLHPWGISYSTYSTLPDLTDDELSRCFITLRARSMGAFPYREKTGLAFPNDGELREFHVSGWEYLTARDTECLQDCEIVECRKYYETIEFNEYVDYFFELKTIADAKMNNSVGQERAYWTAQRLFAKIFLNALYGKFASNPTNYEEFMTIPANMIDGACSDGWNYCKLLCEETAVVNKPLDEEKHRYYDVAVAASITGYVRAYLWRNLCLTNGTMLYCDTDSIAAGDVSAIDTSEGLGKWELEAQCDFAAIAGKKLYAFRKLNGDYKTATKGVRLKPSEIIEIANGATVTYQPEAPTFSIKRGINFTPRTIKMLDSN